MKTKENGQIIVILAVALVAVLGITALAVDGSMIFQERRDDQTTADSSALSAAQTASASTTCATARTAAINQAISYASVQEGVTLLNDSTSPNRVEATCSADNKTLTIKVVVTSNTPTTFAKMVSRNQLQTRVESTSQVNFGSGVFAGGSALWSTGPTCDANGGIWLEGTAVIKITGGGAYSKSCISVKSSPSGVLSDSSPIYYSGTTGTNVRTVYVGSQIQYLGVADQSGSNGLMLANWQDAYVMVEPSLILPKDIYQYQVNPDPNTLIAPEKWPIPSPLLPSPVFTAVMAQQTCSGLSDKGTPDGTTTLYDPGLYTSMFIDANAGATLNQGVYCIKPGGSVVFDEGINVAKNTIFYFQGAGSFKLTGGTDKVDMTGSSIYLTNGDFDVDQGIFYSDAITIYIKQGSFFLRNGAKGASMKAPICSDSSCGVGPAIKGVLVFMDPANTGGFNIKNGNGAHYLAGTVYAPNALAVFDGGTATNSIDVQLIAKRIQLQGSAAITMDTDDGGLYTSGGGTSIELLK